MRAIRKKKLTRRAAATVAQLIPVESYEDMIHAFRTKEGYMDIYGIRTINMNALTPYEQDYEILVRRKFLQSYEGEIKMVSIVFPVDLSEQRQFLVHKHSAAEDPYIRKIIEEKLRELEKLEDGSIERDYYYMIFADDREEIRKAQVRLESLLQNGVIRLTKEAKISVLRQICHACG